MKVFISSTYKDLIEYRKAAIEAVERTSFQAVKMELSGERSGEPLAARLKEIEQSDLFIGIYAYQYGHIPDGTGISVTEMEYHHAKKLGKPIYCFMMDLESQPWPSDWIKDEPGQSKLKAFKMRIQKNHVCAFFTTPDDLEMRVANTLIHFVANYKQSPGKHAIFISYRREDSADVSGRIYDKLVAYFGKEAVFKDVDSIPLGVDFRKFLQDSVRTCNIFLAVIGKHWAVNESGQRQIMKEDDWVRIETETALKRRILVVPILVQRTSMPSRADLPESLHPLIFRNGLDVRPDPDFHNDMSRLIKKIERNKA